MFRSLLVPLDGSPFGEHALPLALAIARRSGASLQLMRVHVPYAFMYTDSMSTFAEVADRALQEQEHAYLAGLIERLARVSSVPVTSVHAEGLEIAGMLEAHAERSQIDLIVMTTHGHGPLSRFWLGSVADELVRRATVPVLLVRPQEAEAHFNEEPVFQHVLIPLDGSALAEQVLEPALTLGGLMQADYTLVRVVRPRPLNGLPLTGHQQPTLADASAAAQSYLDRVAERLRSQGLTVQTEVVAGKQAAVGILEEAGQRGSDLIALETHGRRGLSRLRLGSVADKVIRGACTPVLVHRTAGG